MEPLSGLDASFLYLETPTLHMHVEMVTVFDPATVPGGYSFAKMQAQIASRTHQAPVFRRLLVEVPFRLGHPVWVDDPHFDIDYHVRRTAVPAPGGLLELADLAGDIASRQLDRSKPLWEIWVVEGVDDGRIAVIAKMHHSTVDGMSGAALLSVLFDLEVDPGPGARAARGGRRPAHPVERRAHQRGDGRPGLPPLRDDPGHPAHRTAAAQRATGPQRARAPCAAVQGGPPAVGTAHVVQRHAHPPAPGGALGHRAGGRQAAEERHRHHRQRRRPGRVHRRAPPVPGRRGRAARTSRWSPWCPSRSTPTSTRPTAPTRSRRCSCSSRPTSTTRSSDWWPSGRAPRGPRRSTTRSAPTCSSTGPSTPRPTPSPPPPASTAGCAWPTATVRWPT